MLWPRDPFPLVLAVVAFAIFTCQRLPTSRAATICKNDEVSCISYGDRSPLLTAGDTYKALLLTNSRKPLQATGDDAALVVAARDGNLEELKRLIENGADTEARDADSFTPLMWASTNGNVEIVDFLLEKGADINATSIQGFSSLSEASFSGHAEIVVILIDAGANVDQSDREGFTSLHLAVQEAQLTVARVLLRNGIDIEARSKRTGATPLLLAAEFGRVVMFKELIKHGANVSARDDNGATAFHYASASLEWEPVMEALLEAGGDINALDDARDTPLEYAAWVGNFDAVRWLTANGGDPTIADVDGELAWEELCGCEEGDLFALSCVPGSCKNTTANNEIRLLLGGEAIPVEASGDPCANLPPPQNLQCYRNLGGRRRLRADLAP